MLKTSLAALTVLLLATSAHAEQPSDEGPAAAAPAPPPVAASETAPAPPVAPERVPPAFKSLFLSYDDDAEVVRQGSARRPISPVDFYVAVNRPDLVQKAGAALQRRVILAVAGGAVLAAGVTTAVIAQVGMPNLNSGFCVATVPMYNYNRVCVPDEQRRTTLTAVGLVGGISLSALLGTLAYWSGPAVVSKDEASTLIAQHNADLLKHLRSEGGDLRVSPYASAQGAGVVTTFSF